MKEKVIEYAEHLPIIIEHANNLTEQLEEIKKDVDKSLENFVQDDALKFTLASPEPIYKLKHLTTLPSAEFIVDLINSMRVHVHGETDVYENHPDMFETP